MLFLTVDPLVGISVFIAKLSERQYCWRVFEDFHCQEYIQFLDIHNCLLMRLHFSIGGYDCRWTSRRRQSIHFRGIQVLFLLIMCIDAPESTTKSLTSGLIADGEGRHLYFPKVRRKLFYLSPNFRIHLAIFHAASRAYRLAFLSLLDTDPQISEHSGYADEDHLGKKKSERRILVSNVGVT